MQIKHLRPLVVHLAPNPIDPTINKIDIGKNCAFILLDEMFTRNFLVKCSWSGGSRLGEKKIMFQSGTNITALMLTVIKEIIIDFTFKNLRDFIGTQLRNSKRRATQSESGIHRQSATKHKSKICKTDDNKVDIESIVDDNGKDDTNKIDNKEGTDDDIELISDKNEK